MTGLLADAHFEGHFRRLLQIARSEEWRDVWDDLAPAVETFRSLGLPRDAKDRAISERCQADGLLLVTGNRNHEGPDSLEAAIRTGGAGTLPVLTLGTADRILYDAEFARLVSIHLLEYIQDMRLDPGCYLGAGRLYLPRPHAP